MGWQNIFAALLQAGNTVVINGNGFFVYNGKPALGNLVASSAPNAGVDSAGNAYFAGDGIYGSNGTINLSNNGGLLANPAMLFHTLGTTPTVFPQVVSAIQNAGLANEQVGIILSSGAEGHDNFTIELFSESADTTIGATMIIGAGAVQIITANTGNVTVNVPITANGGTTGTPTNITSDVWSHPTVFNNGWTGQNQGFWYRLTNDKELEILGDLTGGPAGNSTIITFSGIYVPNVSQNHPAGQNNPGGTSPGWVFMSNTGVLSAIGVPAGTAEFLFHVWIPVNLVAGGRG